MTVVGQSFTERKAAGRDLMKEIMTLVHLREEGEKPIARIGGFDLVFAGGRFGREDFRYEVMLARTGADSEIDLALTVTPLGAAFAAWYPFSDGHESGAGILELGEERFLAAHGEAEGAAAIAQAVQDARAI